MTERIECPSCGRSLSADLHIDARENGFVKVHLGMKCKACKTLYTNLAGYLLDKKVLVK